MNEYGKAKLRVAAALVLFAVFTGMVVVGQTKVGYANLGLMLLGLGGILALLYFYNKRFK